ncbi:MAG: hypothetical protein ACXWFC_13005 [Nitrososphaeraceae archaeon]
MRYKIKMIVDTEESKNKLESEMDNIIRYMQRRKVIKTALVSIYEYDGDIQINE